MQTYTLYDHLDEFGLPMVVDTFGNPVPKEKEDEEDEKDEDINWFWEGVKGTGRGGLQTLNAVTASLADLAIDEDDTSDLANSIRKSRDRSIDNILRLQELSEAAPVHSSLREAQEAADEAEGTLASVTAWMRAHWRNEDEGKWTFLLGSIAPAVPAMMGFSKLAGLAIRGTTKKAVAARSFITQAATSAAITGGPNVSEGLAQGLNYDDAEARAVKMSYTQAMIDGTAGAFIPFKIAPGKWVNIPAGAVSNALAQTGIQGAAGIGGEVASRETVGEEADPGAIAQAATFSAAGLPGEFLAARQTGNTYVPPEIADIYKPGLQERWKRWMSGQNNLTDPDYESMIRRDSTLKADEYALANDKINYTKARAAAKKRGANLDIVDADLREYLVEKNNNVKQVLLMRMEPEMAAFAQEMRTKLDTASIRAMNSGAVPADMIQIFGDNLGAYLNRSYRAFDDPDWMDNIPQQVMDDVIDYHQNYQNSINRPVSRDESVGWARNLVVVGKAADNVFDFVSGGTLGSKDIGILKKRKDLPVEVRKLLGEYEDPWVNYTKSMTKLSRLAANHKFQEDVIASGDGVYLFKKPTGDHYHPIGGSGMGALAKMHTTPEIAQAFHDFVENDVLSPPMKAIVGFNAFTKYSKTVLSPVTHARNFVSGLGFAMANGHLLVKGKKRDSFAWFANEMMPGAIADAWISPDRQKALRDYGEGLMRKGLLHDNPFSAEMLAAIEDFKKSEGSKFTGEDLLRKVGEIYQLEDDFWKMAGYESEKKLLMEHYQVNEAVASELAVKRINDTYPTYSRVPQAVKWARRYSPLGTFISFPAEIVRTTKNMIKYFADDVKKLGPNHPLVKRRFVGLLGAHAWTLGVSSASMAALGISDEDDEAFREMSAPWAKNAQNMYFAPDDDGNVRAWDMSYHDPYTYLHKPFVALMRDSGQNWEEKAIDAITAIAEPFVAPSIAYNSIAEIVYNKKKEGGRIYNEQDTPLEQTKQMYVHLRKDVQPGFISTAERQVKAREGARSVSGKQYNEFDENLAIAGFRINTLNPRMSLQYRADKFARDKSEAQQILTRPLSSAEDISNADMKATFNRMMDAREGVYNEMIRFRNFADHLGIEQDEIRTLLDTQRTSAVDVDYLMRGEIPKWAPSKQFIGVAKERLIEGAPNDAERMHFRREFDRRTKFIEELANEYYKKY